MKYVLPETVRAKNGILALGATYAAPSSLTGEGLQSKHSVVKSTVLSATTALLAPIILPVHQAQPCPDVMLVAINSILQLHQHPRVVWPWLQSPAYPVTLLQKGLRFHTAPERG